MFRVEAYERLSKNGVARMFCQESYIHSNTNGNTTQVILRNAAIALSDEILIQFDGVKQLKNGL